MLLMLYEGAIQHLKKAIQYLEEKNIAKKGEHISKAHAIVNELLNTLDYEVGGKIAADLDRLYNYMIQQIIQANMNNTVEPLQSTLKLLETLLDGWKTAVEQFNKSPGKP